MRKQIFLLFSILTILFSTAKGEISINYHHKGEVVHQIIAQKDSIAEKYTITLHDGNNTSTIESQINQSLQESDMPTASQQCNHWNFYGWTTSFIEQTSITPTIIKFPYIPEKDTDLYAVYISTTADSLIMKEKTIPANWIVNETRSYNSYINLCKNNFIKTSYIQNITKIEVTTSTNKQGDQKIYIITDNKDIYFSQKSPNKDNPTPLQFKFSTPFSTKLTFQSYCKEYDPNIAIKEIIVHHTPVYSSNINCETTYNVQFNPNNKNEEEKRHYSISQNHKKNITLPLNSFTNGDKEFIEWNTAADGSGISYNNGDIVKNITQDITLYAQWGMLIDATETENINETKYVDILKINSNIDINSNIYEQSGQLIVAPKHQLTAHKVIVEKIIDESRYFFFSLPFDCKINDIIATSDEGALTYYDNYTIFYYDQVKAANNKGATGKKAWVEITDDTTTLNANQGYIIGYLANKGIAKIRFKSDTTQTISAPTTTTLNIKDYIWYTKGEEITANGWNLIGIPFYQNSIGNINPNLVTIPNTDGYTYTQKDYTDTIITSLTSFFIQTTEAPTFTIASETQPTATPMLRTKDIIAKATISLSDANGKTDQTTIINNHSKTDAYEIGHDLTKWIGYAEIPQIYTIQNKDKLAFNSLMITDETIIPIGVYAHTDGEYTFSLDKKSIGDLQNWELYDNVNDKAIKLEKENLTVTLEQGSHENRFFLRINRETTTECDCDMSNIITYINNGTFYVENMPTNTIIYIYDTIGRMIYTTKNTNTTFNYTFSLRGIYNVVICTEYNMAAFKVIY